MTCSYFYVKSKPFGWRETDFVKQVFNVGGDEESESCEIGRSRGRTDDFKTAGVIMSDSELGIGIDSLIGWFPVNDGFQSQSGVGNITRIQLKGRPRKKSGRMTASVRVFVPLGVAIWDVGNGSFIRNELF
jgi:hypothetical protein